MVRVDLWPVLVAVRDLKKAGVAKQCGVSERTLRRFLIGRRVSARSMDKILRGLDLNASDVLTYLKPGGQ